MTVAKKLRLPYIQETIWIDGVYCVERRRNQERRISQRPWRFYERRIMRDKRIWNKKPVSIWV